MRHYGTKNHTSAPGRPMGGGRGACGAWPRCRWAVVALHPLRGVAPEQKGCNAYGSGVAPSSTRKVAVFCWMTMLGSLLNGAART